MGVNLRKLPSWFLSGIIIFPVLIVLGFVFFLSSSGEISILFWLVIPSIIFEEIFEICCYTFSNSQIINIIFALLFWFVIGAGVNWLVEKIKKINY